MKAVIMAGGDGTRLRPLTCDIPKPMARLCGRPVMEYILDLLGANGVSHAAITLKYLPEIIRGHFPDNVYHGMKLDFFEEDQPLGTAGSVKNASSMLDDDFIVISGDALCDFDLSLAVKFHKEKGAAATLLLSHVADPREYGLVVTGADFRIKGFVEKPGWAQAVTDAVNTGIYIINPTCLSLIPVDRQFDFAKDLFPLMMSKGMPIYGYEADGYWCDIGDISAYTACQLDILEARVSCKMPGFKQEGIQTKSTMPTGNFTIKPPVYIGESVKIGSSAIIGPYAVIDDGSSVGFGSTIKNSVILQDAYIGDRCELRGALVCTGASLKKGAAMFEGSVAGAGAVLGKDASVSPNVRIWPGKKVEDGARAAVNLKYGMAYKGLFDDDGISGEINVELTPEACAKIGAAAGSAFDNGKIGVATDGSKAAEALKNAVSSGILSAGTQVWDFGSCFEALFNFTVSFCDINMGILARTAGSRAMLKLVGPSGLSVGRAIERKIDSAVSTGDIRRCPPSEYKTAQSMQGLSVIYQQQLLKSVPERLDGVFCTVKSANKDVQRTLSEVLKQLGCNDGGIKIHLDGGGTGVSFFDENGMYIDYNKSLAMGCIIAFENGEDVALAYDAPRAIDTIAKQYSRNIYRYLECPADSSDKAARVLAKNQMWVRDGLICAIKILSYLKKNNTNLEQMLGRLPDFALAVKAVSCTGNPGNILRILSAAEKSSAQAGPSEGVLLTTSGGGKVLVSPLKRGTGLRILAEAVNMEAAAELCDFYEKKLQNNDMLDNSRQ
jgi:mannose-1-phosphate guanylyltransferase/phosphomannomutase